MVSAVLFPLSLRVDVGRDAFAAMFDLADGLVFVEVRSRTGSVEFEVEPSSSSERTTVGLRFRFAGRGRDMSCPKHHFEAVCIGDINDAEFARQ